jgi:hypothetical protein
MSGSFAQSVRRAARETNRIFADYERPIVGRQKRRDDRYCRPQGRQADIYGHNLTRVMNIVGTKPLMAVIAA